MTTCARCGHNPPGCQRCDNSYPQVAKIHNGKPYCHPLANIESCWEHETAHIREAARQAEAQEQALRRAQRQAEAQAAQTRIAQIKADTPSQHQALLIAATGFAHLTLEHHWPDLDTNHGYPKCPTCVEYYDYDEYPSNWPCQPYLFAVAYVREQTGLELPVTGEEKP